jgi:zinc transport system substrate-binding protein
MRAIVPLSLFLLASIVASCGRTRHQDPASDFTAAVSVVPQTWLVSEIGGERWDVFPLVLPGDSPASYQPTDAQISRLMQADLYFRIGVPFEQGPWFKAISTGSGPSVVDLRAGIPLREMESHTDEQGEDDSAYGHNHTATGVDPHIWLAPELLRIQAATIADALVKADPVNADDYRMNLLQVQTRLDALHVDLQQRLEDLKGRRFYIFHPAWGYFADAYGLEQVAVEVEGKEPTDAELTALQLMARRDGVTVIFVQPQIRGGTVQALAAAIGGRVQELDPLAPDVPRNLIRAAEALARALR